MPDIKNIALTTVSIVDTNTLVSCTENFLQQNIIRDSFFLSVY